MINPKFILASSLSIFLVACTQGIPANLPNSSGLSKNQSLQKLQHLDRETRKAQKNIKTKDLNKVKDKPQSVFNLVPNKPLAQALTNRGPRKELSQIKAQITLNNDNTQDLNFSFTLPQTFSTQFLETERIAKVKFVVRGADLTKEYESDFVTFVEGQATASITKLPVKTGQRRVITAYGYDSQNRLVPAFEAWGYFDSSATSATVQLNRAQMIVGRTLWELMQEDSNFANSINLNTFQANVVSAIMTSPADGFVFEMDPLYFNPQTLANYIMDNSGTLPDEATIDTAQVDNQGVTVFVSAQNNLQFAEDITLFLDDPASTRAIILDQSNSPARVRFTNVAPGEWNLIARDSDGNEVGRTQVAVNHEGMPSMTSGDTDTNPFTLSSVDTRTLDCGSTAALPANVIAVADCGNNSDGSSWANAYTDLQDALDAAESGDEIWVAAGVYKPDMETFDTNTSFNIPAGVSLYGGFGGGEDERTDRDTDYKPVLSGDLNGDDIVIDADWDYNQMQLMGRRSDNSTSVVEMTETDALIDNFTVRNGGNSSNDGAGLYLNRDGSINNLIFESNLASQGAGVFYEEGPSSTPNAILTDNIFRRNYAQDGAGMFVDSDVDLTLSDSLFQDNYATDEGGGMCLSSSTINATITNTIFENNHADEGAGVYVSLSDSVDVTFDDVIFRDNIAESNGGGLYAEFDDYSGPQELIITNTLFENNQANGSNSSDGGGAIFVETYYGEGSGNEMRVQNSIFRGNSAPNGSARGGSIYIDQTDDTGSSSYEIMTINIYDSVFDNNSADDGGAIFYNFTSSDPSYDIVNSIFYNNSARDSGGAIAIADNDESPTLDIISSHFVNNSAGTNGGAVAVLEANGLDLNIFNSIFWGNTASGSGYMIHSSDSDANIDLNYNLIQELTDVGLSGGIFNQSNNSSDDPQFINLANPWGDDGLPATNDDGLIPESTSPAGDSGTNVSGNATNGNKDILGNTRSDVYDKGAYEFLTNT